MTRKVDEDAAHGTPEEQRIWEEQELQSQISEAQHVHETLANHTTTASNAFRNASETTADAARSMHRLSDAVDLMNRRLFRVPRSVHNPGPSYRLLVEENYGSPGNDIELPNSIRSLQTTHRQLSVRFDNGGGGGRMQQHLEIVVEGHVELQPGDRISVRANGVTSQTFQVTEVSRGVGISDERVSTRIRARD